MPRLALNIETVSAVKEIRFEKEKTTAFAHAFALEEQTVSTIKHESPFEIKTVTEVKKVLLTFKVDTVKPEAKLSTTISFLLFIVGTLCTANSFFIVHGKAARK